MAHYDRIDWDRRRALLAKTTKMTLATFGPQSTSFWVVNDDEAELLLGMGHELFNVINTRTIYAKVQPAEIARMVTDLAAETETEEIKRNLNATVDHVVDQFRQVLATSTVGQKTGQFDLKSRTRKPKT